MQDANAYGGGSYTGCTGVINSINVCKGICPAGFHVPTHDEFEDAIAKFPAMGCSGINCWKSGSPWNGVFGGFCQNGDHCSETHHGYYWSSTGGGTGGASRLNLENGGKDIVEVGVVNRYSGLSLRCVSTPMNVPVSAGAISPGNGTAFVDTNPGATITSSSDASGGDGNITYEWRRSGTSSATFSHDASTYSIGSEASNYSTAGIYTFTRYAKDGTCNTDWMASTGIYTLTVSDWKSCGSGLTDISNNAFDGDEPWDISSEICSNKGMRLPTKEELQCLCKNKNNIPGGYSTADYYWSSTEEGTSGGHYAMKFTYCSGGIYYSVNGNRYFKCVK
jgi:uncharacterized protein (TIGR02145 family)